MTILKLQTIKMLKSYLKTAFRFLLKNKTYSLINIIGLAVGTLCCLYILLYVEDQYSYDKYQKDANNIYRINTYLDITGDKHNSSASSPPIAPALKHDFAEVVQFTRVVPMLNVGKSMLKYKDRSFYEKESIYADSTFFDVFTYHFVFGKPANALLEPYTVVLQQPLAEKLFGKDNPVGKVINIENGYGKHDFKVMGVVDESLGKTHMQANMFVTMNSGGFGAYTLTNTHWAGNNYAYSYIKLRPDASAAALEKKLPAFLFKYGEAQLKELGIKKVLHLQPVTAIHTTAGLEHEISKTVSTSFLYILILIAVLIQVIACINFMNLSTARASKRAKEVGVRKVVGAGRKDLIRQFLGESFLLAMTGVLVALPLLIVALPYLNQITSANIQLTLFKDYRLWLVLGGLVVVTGFVAGSYPAFYLSAFQAIKVIKGNFNNQVSAAGIRRSLVVFQFVLSIVLITGIIVIYSQLNFIKNKDLGFDTSQKLVFSFYTDDAQKQMVSFSDDLKQMHDVSSVTFADNYLSQFIPHDHGVFPAGGSMATAIDAQNIASDEFFVQTNGIKLIGGRDLRLNDSGKVLINETLAKRLGFTAATAPGTRLYTQYAPDPVTFVEVAGVMKDFNYASLHGEVNPFMLVYEKNRNYLANMIVAVNSNNYKDVLAKMEGLWQKHFAGVPFEYVFVNDEVQKMYETETTLGNIINSFTLMAILISCLGLFGLAAFSAEQRSKEIGIRKVLGASVTSVTSLLSKDFLKLVIVAFVIAIPIAYWAMTQWLQGFAYRVPISWWMFAIAGVLSVAVALVTVSFQAIKAAVANPIRSLKTE